MVTATAPANALSKKSVFLIDDHAVLRDSLARLLNDQDDLVVSGEAGTARQALSRLERVNADLIVADISMPGSNGIELIKSLRAQFLGLPVIILSMHDEGLYAERALRAGAKGYVMKQAPAEELLKAIRTVMRGEVYLSPNLSRRLLGSFVGQKRQTTNNLELLSDRELEILRLLGKGFTTREIATDLGISAKTVESHRGNLRQKLNLDTGAELTRFAIANRDDSA